jgi:hypothetical protein
LSINRCSAPVLNPKNFPNPKIQPSRHLTPKSQIPFRIVPENGSAVPVSIHQPDLPVSKINPELPRESLFAQFPHIEQYLALAFQLPSQVLRKDVPHSKIIETPFSAHPLEMLPGFPVPIPGIVFLTATPVFPDIFDSDIFDKMFMISRG